jgi:hypothetical protein
MFVQRLTKAKKWRPPCFKHIRRVQLYLKDSNVAHTDSDAEWIAALDRLPGMTNVEITIWERTLVTRAHLAPDLDPEAQTDGFMPEFVRSNINSTPERSLRKFLE